MWSQQVGGGGGSRASPDCLVRVCAIEIAACRDKLLVGPPPYEKLDVGELAAGGVPFQANQLATHPPTYTRSRFLSLVYSIYSSIPERFRAKREEEGEQTASLVLAQTIKACLGGGGWTELGLRRLGWAGLGWTF